MVTIEGFNKATLGGSYHKTARNIPRGLERALTRNWIQEMLSSIRKVQYNLLDNISTGIMNISAYNIFRNLKLGR